MREPFEQSVIQSAALSDVVLAARASRFCLSLSVVVLSKQVVPTVGYADEDVFLPQWAIAGIVIGLASLLFVIIFGVTVVSMLITTVCSEHFWFEISAT